MKTKLQRKLGIQANRLADLKNIQSNFTGTLTTEEMRERLLKTYNYHAGWDVGYLQGVVTTLENVIDMLEENNNV